MLITIIIEVYNSKVGDNLKIVTEEYISNCGDKITKNFNHGFPGGAAPTALSLYSMDKLPDGAICSAFCKTSKKLF